MNTSSAKRNPLFQPEFDGLMQYQNLYGTNSHTENLQILARVSTQTLMDFKTSSENWQRLMQLSLLTGSVGTDSEFALFKQSVPSSILDRM